jgi:hypothetical protein
VPNVSSPLHRVTPFPHRVQTSVCSSSRHAQISSSLHRSALKLLILLHRVAPKYCFFFINVAPNVVSLASQRARIFDPSPLSSRRDFCFRRHRVAPQNVRLLFPASHSNFIPLHRVAPKRLSHQTIVFSSRVAPRHRAQPLSYFTTSRSKILSPLHRITRKNYCTLFVASRPNFFFVPFRHLIRPTFFVPLPLLTRPNYHSHIYRVTPKLSSSLRHLPSRQTVGPSSSADLKLSSLRFSLQNRNSGFSLVYIASRHLVSSLSRHSRTFVSSSPYLCSNIRLLLTASRLNYCSTFITSRRTFISSLRHKLLFPLCHIVPDLLFHPYHILTQTFIFFATSPEALSLSSSFVSLLDSSSPLSSQYSQF